MTKTYEERLDELRAEYKTATLSRRRTIELQARALQAAIRIRDKKYERNETRSG